MKNFFRNGLAIFVATLFLASTSKMVQPSAPKLAQDTLRIDHDYVLEATMLGYFAKDGTRNPTLKANKGKRVRITIYNGEMMTHDIALEKAGIKTPSISDKGAKVSMTFIAKENDIYFCTVPGHRAAGMVGKLEIVTGETETIASTGVIPTKKGKSINVNFEKGTLENWKATGEAFLNPLISQDPSPLHDKALKINPERTYFLSSGGSVKYALTGTLTSESFKITHPFASFLVSGGAIQDTRVELVLAKGQQVIFKSTGQGRATLQPVVANLKAHLGKEMFIRIIDNETGISPIPYVGHDKLAHINFDNFRFHATRPTFPNELNQKDIIVLPPLDPILHAGLSGKEAARAMTLPKGFKITLAASEPDIVRPISFTMDPRGRLWVVEGHTYPIPAPEGQGKDRILIFEDTDGDGTLDKRKVFMEGLNLVSGIEVGMGGVWLGAAPYLLFIPTDFTQDKPTGPIQKLLDGWGVQDTHEVLNSLRWGPDGWLYGTHGVFTHSNVGKPGATDQERTKINAGVWRFHPKAHVFEVFAEGSSNPWGIDFNEYGHPFITVCVIPHMFHIIQGARYQRQGGKHFNPYTYDDIKTIADHVHYVGDRGPHAGNFRSASAGGGHAHAGAMIYLGGNTWPKEFRNNIFMNNINGAKLNVDILTPKGSGYTASHKKDFLSMNDSWSQWLNMKYDPSGSVYAIDWYDKNQCHSTNPDVHDKTMGRIFKITHEKDAFVRVDLSKSTDLELVNHQLNPNEWYVRQSRTILQERGGNAQVYNALRDILDKNPDVTRKLRALWTLQVTGGLTEMDLEKLLGHESPHVRSWAIQLATEKKGISATFLSKLESMAKTESSAQVRLAMLSGVMRLRPEMRWNVVEALAQKSEDRLDHNIPLMVWYAAEPLAAIDPVRSLAMAEKAMMPKFLLYMVQRIGAIKSGESKKILEGFRDRLGNNHEQHEIMMVVEKALKENQ